MLIEPFRPGVAERLGFGPEIVLKLNPNIIYARLTGWGQYGNFFFINHNFFLKVLMQLWQVMILIIFL